METEMVGAIEEDLDTFAGRLEYSKRSVTAVANGMSQKVAEVVESPNRLAMTKREMALFSVPWDFRYRWKRENYPGIWTWTYCEVKQRYFNFTDDPPTYKDPKKDEPYSHVLIDRVHRIEESLPFCTWYFVTSFDLKWVMFFGRHTADTWKKWEYIYEEGPAMSYFAPIWIGKTRRLPNSE